MELFRLAPISSREVLRFPNSSSIQSVDESTPPGYHWYYLDSIVSPSKSPFPNFYPFNE